MFLIQPTTITIEDFLSLLKSASPKTITLAMSSILKISQNAVKTSTNQIFGKTMEKLQLEYYKNIAIITKGDGFNENTTNGNNNRTFILLGTVDTILSSPIFEGLRRKSKNPYNLQA